jgi:hypothetical protein
MLLFNTIPALHALTTLSCWWLPLPSLWQKLILTLLVLYLFPALAARLIQTTIAIPEGHIAIGTKAFFAWWILFQLQVIFCRLPFLEELLRLVPGLYSQWLRLWGSDIGRFTYWSAGTQISDRTHLTFGDQVVLGAGVRLNAHVLVRNASGSLELILARIIIGNHTIIGGYSLLTAGTEISSNEVTRACLVSPPFSVWKDGKRVRVSD